jgi:Rad3-related DNA helicase
VSIPRDLTPADLGFSSTKFAEFREIQLQLADWFVYGDPDLGRRRFMIAGASGGSGKSLGINLISKLMGVKTAILTFTKGLQDQVLVSDFPDLADIRGKVNYTCVTRNFNMPDQRWTCDEGYDIKCAHVGDPDRCTHSIQMELAKRARVVSANYSAWLSNRAVNATAFEEKGKPIQLLVLDEAQKAPDALSNHLQTHFSKTDLHKHVEQETRLAVRLAHGADHGIVSQSWIAMLETLAIRVKAVVSDIGKEYRSEAEAYREDKEYRRLSRMLDNIDRLTFHASDNNWIWIETKYGYKFDCIWPWRYAERYLFSGVPNVLLITATARPKLAQLLGIKKEQMLFREWPRIFPAVNGPVIHVPTGRMGQRADETEKQKSVARLDEFLDLGWRKVKGAVHTSNYRLAEWVQSRSKYGRYMLLNKQGESADAMAERFRLAKCDDATPCILVSPSYGTGYDFDLYEQQEWSFNFIIKLPYADKSDPIVVERMKQDKTWYAYATMQDLCQSCWRFTRRPEAKCMTIVTDDSVGFLLRSGAEYKPRWFTVQERKELPRPPVGIGTRARIPNVAGAANGSSASSGTNVPAVPLVLPLGPAEVAKALGVDFSAYVNGLYGASDKGKEGKRVPSSPPSALAEWDESDVPF